TGGTAALRSADQRRSAAFRGLRIGGGDARSPGNRISGNVADRAGAAAFRRCGALYRGRVGRAALKSSGGSRRMQTVGGRSRAGNGGRWERLPGGDVTVRFSVLGSGSAGNASL